jgi:FixJ family two-component response regulator
MRRCNPWGITRRQAEALDKLTEVGCRKVVAYEMDISEQALCVMLKRACSRMKVRTDMQAVVTFDRWART